jgi:hypothetical protein
MTLGEAFVATFTREWSHAPIALLKQTNPYLVTRVDSTPNCINIGRFKNPKVHYSLVRILKEK